MTVKELLDAVDHFKHLDQLYLRVDSGRHGAQLVSLATDTHGKYECLCGDKVEVSICRLPKGASK